MIFERLNKYLLIFFLVVCVILPKDVMGFKKLAFVALFALNFPYFIKYKYDRFHQFIMFFAVLFPLITICISTLQTGDLSNSFLLGYPPLFMLIYYIVRWGKVNFEKYLLFSLSIMIIFLNVIVLLDLLGIIKIGYVLLFMMPLGIGSFGNSESFTFYYKIFFATSPLLVVSLFYYYDKKYYIKMFFTLTALIISGTRGNVIFPIMFMILFIMFSKSTKYWKKFALAVFVIGILVYNWSVINQSLFEKNVVSDGRRVAHINGYLELFDNKPWSYLLGQGMGSDFRTDAYFEPVKMTEFSYIEIVRQFGVFFGLLYFIFVFYPYLKAHEKNSYYLYAYTSYLAIAWTNPLLYCSTGYIMFVYIYLKVRDTQRTLRPDKQQAPLAGGA